MKYTNKYNWPQPMVDAIANDSYDKGPVDLSITTLIAPPRIRVLTKMYQNELTQDVSDMFHVFLGQLAHGVLERANKVALAEKRFFIEIDGVTLSGQCDAVYDNGLIQDYKLVSYFQVQDGVKPEFVQQLNCYAYLIEYGYILNENGTKSYLKLKANKLQDFFMFKDWTKSKARRDRDVPPAPALTYDVPLWSSEETLAFMRERIALHKAANKKLPLCTSEEMWETPEKFAVMKPGAVKSSKNHLNKEDAEQHAERIGAKVEYRPGSRKRCEDGYCMVAKFCTQYQKYLARTGKVNKE